MSIGCFNIIYGVPVTEKIIALGQERLQELGFEFLYDGWSDFQPGYLGVSLYSFDSANGNFPASELYVTPTEAQEDKIKAKFQNLPKEVQDLCEPLDCYLIASND